MSPLLSVLAFHSSFAFLLSGGVPLAVIDADDAATCLSESCAISVLQIHVSAKEPQPLQPHIRSSAKASQPLHTRTRSTAKLPKLPQLDHMQTLTFFIVVGIIAAVLLIFVLFLYVPFKTGKLQQPDPTTCSVSDGNSKGRDSDSSSSPLPKLPKGADSELDKEAFLKEIEGVWRKFDGWYQSSCQRLQLEIERAKTHQLSFGALRFEELTAVGHEASKLWKLSRRARREAVQLADDSASSLKAPVQQLLQEFAFFHASGLSAIVRGLSELHSAQIVERTDEPREAGDVFARVNRKFVVETDRLVDLIFSIVPHLPVHSHQKGGDLFSAFVSSVYLDNDDLDYYNARIAKTASAPLYRVRWYGAFETEFAFVEQKLKSDESVGEPSRKNRFRIPEAEVNDFLFGGGGLEAAETASSGFRLEFGQSIRSTRAAPVTRTSCKRMAFQLDKSEATRITIDWDLKVLMEDGCSGSVSVPRNWRRLDARPEDPFDAAPGTLAYGKSIVEVKLQGECPDWLTEVLDAGDLKEVGFSKYEFSVARLLAHRSIAEPFWLEQLRADEEEEEEEDASEEKASSTDITDGDRPPPSRAPAARRLDAKVVLKVEAIFIKYVSYALIPGGAATLLGIPHYRLLVNVVISCVLLVYAVYQYRRRMSELNSGRLGQLADTTHSWVLTCSAFLFTLTLYPWGVEHGKTIQIGWGAQ